MLELRYCPLGHVSDQAGEILHEMLPIVEELMFSRISVRSDFKDYCVATLIRFEKFELCKVILLKKILQLISKVIKTKVSVSKLALG